MTELDIIVIKDFANVYMFFSLVIVTAYVKCRLEDHIKSKHRWKVLLSAVGLLAFVGIGAIFYSQIGWSDYAKIMYALNIGAIAVIVLIGLPKKLFGLPKKKNSN